MFRIHNYLIYFPPNVLTPSHFPTFFSHSYDPLNYVIPFCTHTRYIPSSIKLWSLSHVDFKNCTSLRSFKFLLHCSANSFVLVHIYLYFLSQLANNCYRENNYCVSKKPTSSWCFPVQNSLPVWLFLLQKLASENNF